MNNTHELRNGKYFAGKYRDFDKTKGWFLGSFMDEASPLKTHKMEVLYKEHQKGDLVKPHYHKEKIELLIFLSGKARYKVNDKELVLRGGDFLFVDVNNVISGEFVEESSIFAIHSPSLPSDKFEEE